MNLHQRAQAVVGLLPGSVLYSSTKPMSHTTIPMMK